MARFRAPDSYTVGTTQTPEFGYCGTTEPVAFGPAHNPWRLGHSPGGSSGGSGAAVGARIVPIAHANDGGGSIRIPASSNGLRRFEADARSHAERSRCVRSAVRPGDRVRGDAQRARRSRNARCGRRRRCRRAVRRAGGIGRLSLAARPPTGAAAHRVHDEIAIRCGRCILSARESMRARARCWRPRPRRSRSVARLRFRVVHQARSRDLVRWYVARESRRSRHRRGASRRSTRSSRPPSPAMKMR